MSKLKKLGIVISTMGLGAIPFIASADYIDYTTTTAIFSTYLSNVAVIIVYMLGVVLTIGASMWGLWYGIGKLRKAIR